MGGLSQYTRLWAEVPFPNANCSATPGRSVATLARIETGAKYN